MGFTYDEEDENLRENYYYTDKVSEWIERNREFYDIHM